MKKHWQLIGGVAGGIIFFILLLGVLVHVQWVILVDNAGYQLLQPTTPLKTHTYIWITRLGDPRVAQPLTVAICLLLWWQKRGADALWYLGVQFIGYALVIMVKYSVLRPRPFGKLWPANGYSFPSGHTFATTILAFTVLALLFPVFHFSWQRWLSSLLAAGWIIAVMASRVYLRDHFASDVCAGLSLAVCWWSITSTFRSTVNHWLTTAVWRL